MHIILAIAGLATAAYLIIIRARNAAEITHELIGVADDVRAAARRLGFRRKGAIHPVDSIDDPNTAAATVAVAYMELHGMPTEDTRQKLLHSLQSALEVSLKEAEELMILGRWLMNECKGAAPAIARSAKRLNALTKGDIGPMLTVLDAISSNPLTDQQREALDDIKRAFHIR